MPSLDQPFLTDIQYRQRVRLTPGVQRTLYTDGAGYRWVAAALAALVSGIEPGEVMQVLAADRRLPVPGTARGVQVLAIFGRTRAGRPLLVLVRLDRGGFDHLIVGARELTSDELVMFERWKEVR